MRFHAERGNEKIKRNLWRAQHPYNARRQKPISALRSISTAATAAEIATGVGFFDYMLTLLADMRAIDLKIEAKGDLHVDQHHTVEDVGICLGLAVRQAAGRSSDIRRYGHFTLPMDETLATTVIDLGGRPYFVFQVEFPAANIGEVPERTGRRLLACLRDERAGQRPHPRPLRPQWSSYCRKHFQVGRGHFAWRSSRTRGLPACQARRACCRPLFNRLRTTIRRRYNLCFTRRP